MSVIKIQDFTGEMPRVSPRELGTNAQTNRNLLATSTEFRPLLADSTVTTATNNAQTLYRLARDAAGAMHTSDSAGWRTDAAYKSYVRGQNPDDSTERTYVTTNDGSAPPRVIDATGQDRLLGVPAPASAPTLTVNDFATYDATQQEVYVAALEDQVYNAVMDNLTAAWVGAAEPTEDQYKHLTEYPEYILRIFILSGENGYITNAFTTADLAKYAWVLDAGLNGVKHLVSGTWFYALKIPAYARGYTVDKTAMTNAFKLLLMPQTEPGVTPGRLVSDAQALDMATKIEDVFATDNPVGAGSLVERLQAAVTVAKNAIDSSASAVTAASAANFYALTPVVAHIDDSISIFATDVAWTASQLLILPPPEGLTGTPTATSEILGGSAIATITAKVGTLYTTGSDGIKRLDAAALDVYLQTKFQAIADTITGANNTAVVQAMVKDNLLAYANTVIDKLNRAIGESWAVTHPSWPVAGDSKAAFQSAANAASGIQQSLTSFYAGIVTKSTIIAAIIEYLDANGVLAAAPQVEARIIDTRFYIVTYVTDWGEESAPSAPSASVEVDQHDTVNVTAATAPSGRNITKWRLYRSNTGTQGAAFQFVGDCVAGVWTFLDDVPASDLGELCPSIGIDGVTHWAEPATRLNEAGALSSKANPYLRGLIAMPNGIMAGFVDNFVAFCDPYHPYAWPVAYQIPLKYPIVGLGVFGHTLFVGTLGAPSLITGTDSASMSEEPLGDIQACVSAKSIASTAGGVLYASPDGICFCSTAGVEVVTTQLFSREDWQALTPGSINAVMHEGVYYFTYTGSGGGCLALDFVAKKLGRVDISATALFADSLTDAVFYVSGTSVKRAFATGRRTGIWKSGKKTLPSPVPFAWLQVDGDQSVGAPVIVRWYGDGEFKHAASLTSTAPVRLPSGRYLEHEIEIESTERITKVMLAGDTQEMKST